MKERVSKEIYSDLSIRISIGVSCRVIDDGVCSIGSNLR